MRNLLKLGAVVTALLALAACGKPAPLPSAPPTSTQPDWPVAFTTPYSEDATRSLPEVTATEAGSTFTMPNVSTKSRPGTTAPTATAPPQVPTTVPTPPQVVSIVIPEGFTFYQVGQRLEANGVCSARDFYNAAQSYQVQSFSAPAGQGVCYRYEGYLFPDTYEFYQGDDPEAVLRKMLNNYAAKSGLPDYDTLILASIIERETRSSEHMAMVSSVFHNRLAQGMKLQADATILYVENHIKKDPLVKNPGQYAERYNTYKCAALPAGPICSPSRRAIEAARNPSQSDYLYYFFGNDNTNHYSVTHEEHEAAMAQYGVQSS